MDESSGKRLRWMAAVGLIAGAIASAASGAWAAGPIVGKPVVEYLAHFDGKDGSKPHGGLVPGGDGNEYGTTYVGGRDDDGVVYRMTPDGALTAIHAFNGRKASGPDAALLPGSDGFLYGTTAQNVAGHTGSIFRISIDGRFETLHLFAPAEGGFVISELIESRDGFLYGTAVVGGDDDRGTVFRISTSGAFERLVSFPVSGALGMYPEAPLLEGDDGNFYGTTTQGGARDDGTLFRMTPAGVLTVLHDFDIGSGGAAPSGRLVYAADHSAILGVTHAGGAHGDGTAWQFAGAKFTKLADFDRAVGWAATALTPGPAPGTYYFFMLTSSGQEHGELMALDPSHGVRHIVDVKGHTASCPPTLAPDGALLGVLESGGKGGYGGIVRITGY
jgi:uncharacterized repeat protein (TIGR03803 family)